MYLRIFGQGFLILTSLDAARELLEQQSKISSDRPPFIMLSELSVSPFTPLVPLR